MKVVIEAFEQDTLGNITERPDLQTIVVDDAVSIDEVIAIANKTWREGEWTNLRFKAPSKRNSVCGPMGVEIDKNGLEI